MLTRSNIRLGLTGALLLVIAGALGACADTVVGVEDPPDPVCVWIDGVIHCEP